MNDLDKAQNCIKEAYTIREKLRSGHHGVIAASKPLANLYSKIVKYDDAIKLLQEACTISNSYYGGNHEKTIELERLLRQAEKEKEQTKKQCSEEKIPLVSKKQKKCCSCLLS